MYDTHVFNIFNPIVCHSCYNLILFCFGVPKEMSLVKLCYQVWVDTSQSAEGSNTTEVEQEEFIQLKDKKMELVGCKDGSVGNNTHIQTQRLELTPQNPCVKSNKWWQILVIPGLRNCRQVNLWVSLASHTNVKSLGHNKRIHLKTTVEMTQLLILYVHHLPHWQLEFNTQDPYGGDP